MWSGTFSLVSFCVKIFNRAGYLLGRRRVSDPFFYTRDQLMRLEVEKEVPRLQNWEETMAEDQEFHLGLIKSYLIL